MLLFFKLPDQSKLKMTTIIVKIFVGGEIQYNDDGVFYSTRAKYSLPLTVNHNFDYLRNEIYQLVGYNASQANMEIQARFNMSTDGGRDHQLVPVTNQQSFEMILGIVSSFPQRLPVLELYVELNPNYTSQIPEPRSRPGTSRNPVDPNPIPVRSRPNTGRHSVDAQRPRTSIGSNTVSVDVPVIPRPSTSRNSVDLAVRPRPSTGRHSVDVPSTSRPSTSRVRRHVRDYSHVPVDAIDSDSLESGDEMLSDEASGSDDDIEPLSQSQSRSRQAQYPITGRENMTHPVDSFNDISGFRPADVDFFGSSNKTFDNPLAKGVVYESKTALRIAINEFHLANNCECKVLRSEPRRYEVVCRDKFCKFKVCAKQIGLSDSWIIKKQALPHTCTVSATRTDHCQLTAEMVALAIDKTIRRDVCASINHIRDLVMQKYDKVTPKYNKLWRGRELAIANLFGSWEGSYNLLIPLFEAIQRNNPGTKYCVTTTPAEKVDERHFHRAAWAFGACIAAIPFLRPVISIDACFMSGRYQGRLLMACMYDAENQLLPLAFAIVEKESADNWGFFMRWLRLEVIGNNSFFCVISDRHLGIKAVFQDPLLGWDESTDQCVHRYCSQHVAENLFKHVGRKREVSDRFIAGVNKCKPRRMQEMLQDFEIGCPEAIDYLNKVGKRNPNDEDELPCPEKLYQTLDGGHRWGIMTTNGSESLNAVFKISRRLPVAAVVEDTFYKLNKWFFDRWNKAQMGVQHGQVWSDRVSTLLQKRIEKGRDMTVIPYRSGHGLFEVLVKGEKIPARRNQPRLEHTRRDFGYRVVVTGNNKVECECRKPQLTGIPCSHFMAVVREMKYDVNLYINPLYRMSIVVQTWSGQWGPKGNQCEWPVYNGPKIIPETRLIKKGRRRHDRIPMEMDRMRGRRLGHQPHRETIDRNAAGIIDQPIINGCFN